MHKKSDQTGCNALPIKKLIITADDFGLNRSVNQAVEKAHREGILTSASLMMGEEALADAVDRCRNMPDLHTGLHLCIVDGHSVLPHSAIPHIVNSERCFNPHMVRSSFRIAVFPKVRQDLEREIRAQFEVYLATGLSLDHVDVHHHLHLHPLILNMMLRIGKTYGMQAVRLVHEPFIFSMRVRDGGFMSSMIHGVFLRPWSGRMLRQLNHYEIEHNDRLFGMYDGERIDEAMLLRLLDHLPNGTTEVHFHPRREDDIETLTLTSTRIRHRIKEMDIQCHGYDNIPIH